ncbi:chloride channel-like protein 3 [Lepidopterella palustris CBS 459.81]|uniref:Chloride channel protein n=1 Tax=Lepidopterella palustris CBS 459.81 TaxID=1314670 RepID=A0A8E2JF72_9PEZI|nr:chloride channel-like protein 3 [Lepidopterella palustris CBS 459.81]
MAPDDEAATERTHLLYGVANDRRLSVLQQDEEARSIIASAVTKNEQHMSGSTVGERLPYNDYTTIDWLHDLVKDSYRFQYIKSRKGLRYDLISMFESCSGWIAVAVIGTLTACVAFIVDVAEATVSDWKFGFCTKNPLLNRESCCSDKTPLLGIQSEIADQCRDFTVWSNNYWGSFAIHVAWALLFGIISSSVTMLTKSSLPAVASGKGDRIRKEDAPSGKSMYMAAGSGIPEIKTILSGFVIPNFLDLKVLIVKAIGAIFAVATGMCLGKEGPFVHISTCVGYLVAMRFPKYRENGRKLRELLSAACASGLSVAFGAPIGGVLFSYEEISTYFPRKVLWRAFLCSLVAAMVLRALNPTGTGKLVLFETNYGTSYEPVHYAAFVLLGISGGVFGGVFCKANFAWSKWFRQYPIIKTHPVFEVFLVVLATTLLQFPNPLTREPGDIVIKNLLVDCRSDAAAQSWVCKNEANTEVRWAYVGWLTYGTMVKLVLTIITFGCKVPSGVIIPALDAGALFGRLIGQSIGSISPGIFAMVGAAAFLAGVSRMTISLCVIMFELTGELEYIVPHMIAILVAKWVADAFSAEGVYDLAQTVLGHPFLDSDHAIALVRKRNLLVQALLPPPQTMAEITVHVPPSNKVPRQLLQQKLDQLHRRGLMDAGLVLVQNAVRGTDGMGAGMLQGYIAEGELDFGLSNLGAIYAPDAEVRLLGNGQEEGEFDLSMFVDRTPVSVCAKAPLEYAVEMFGKLGLRHLCVTEEGTGRLVGVVIKKRLVSFLEGMKEE